VHILFYAAPLVMGLLSLPTREGPRWKQIGALTLGFVGSIMIIAQPAGERVSSLLPGAGLAFLGLAAALCWAAFCLLARPLMREEKVLPSSFIIWTMGAACLLATCLSTGSNPLSITRRGLWLSMVLGGGTVALGFGIWLKCLSEVTPSFAAPLWYVGLVFGIGWGHWMAGTRPGWLTVGGVVLILLFVRSGRSRDRRHTMTLSDVIRG
jgi:drug/metabolite transporter (DMT)-like permease